MLLTAFEISLNVKSLVLMFRFYSAAGISSVLRVELVLRSSLKYSAHSSNKLENKNVGSPFRLFPEEGDVSFYPHLLNFVDFVVRKWYIC